MPAGELPAVGPRPGPRVRLLVTAGAAEGRGHLARGIALARALRAGGARVSLRVLRGGPTERQAATLAEIGATLETDADAGPDAGTGRDAVTVVDLPDPDEAAQHADPTGPLVVFDDRELFSGDAAIVIQPSMPGWAGRARAGRVLAGYAFAPIDEAYLRVAGIGPPTAAPADPRARPTVLVCFGGSDPADVTGRIAPGLLGDARWVTEVVVGAGYRGDRPEAAAPWAVRDPADLPRRLAVCDIAVLGAGTMKFEAAFLGRPAILLAAADDQLPVGPAFAATGAAAFLGDGRTIDPAAVTAAVARLAADRPARQRMSERAREVVDGGGAERLAREIVALADRSA